MIKAVMFDFSGTIFRVTSTEAWLAAHLDAAGQELPVGEKAELVRRMEEFGALPGGVPPRRIPPEVQQAWDTRDLTPELHHTAYTALALAAEPPAGLDVDALYASHISPKSWDPYPDALPVLRELRRRGVPIALVSNVGWDLRPIFRAHGLHGLIDHYVLSCEVGAQKPDPAIFERALQLLGHAPENVLMVGDDERADGGARALGCPFHLVEALPADRRPDGLAPVLDMLN